MVNSINLKEFIESISYPRNETYNKLETDKEIEKFQFIEIVNGNITDLDISNVKNNRIYLEVNNTNIEENKYNLYIYVDNEWEQIDSLEFDIDEFYNRNQIDALLNSKANSIHGHNIATTSNDGFMSQEDKTKLNGIGTGANKTTVDSSLSTTSSNPVQNKVITNALNEKVGSSALSSYAPLNDVYTKSETMDNNGILQAITDGISNLGLFEVVDELPTSNIKKNKLYFVRNDTVQDLCSDKGILNDDATHNIWTTTNAELTRGLEYSTVTETSVGTHAYLGLSETHMFPNNNTVVEFDAYQVDGSTSNNIFFIRDKTNTTSLASFNLGHLSKSVGEWVHIRVFFDGTNTFKVYADDNDTPISRTLNSTDTHYTFLFYTGTANTTIRFKNFRVYDISVPNLYDVYINVKNAWERIDSLDVDISDYYTNSEIDTLLATKIDTNGSGLTKNGTTLNHTNTITAQTSNALKKIAYNNTGHITSTSNATTNDLLESTALTTIGTSNNVTQHEINTAIDDKIKNLVVGDIDLSGTHTHLKSNITDYDIEYVESTHNTSTSTWTGTCNIIRSLNVGTVIFYKLNQDPTSSNVTLNLTVDGTTTGAKNCYFKENVRLSNQYPNGSVIPLIYDGTSWQVINSIDNKTIDGFIKRYDGVYISSSGSNTQPYYRLFHIGISGNGNNQNAHLIFELVSSMDAQYLKLRIDLRQNTPTSTSKVRFYITPLEVINIDLSEFYFGVHKEHGNFYIDVYRKITVTKGFRVKVYDDHIRNTGGQYEQFTPIYESTETYSSVESADTEIYGATTYDEIVNGADYNITANKFIMKNGTSNQFLKADGSIDDNTYLTAHQDITGKSDVGHKHQLSDVTNYVQYLDTGVDLNNYTTVGFYYRGSADNTVGDLHYPTDDNQDEIRLACGLSVEKVNGYSVKQTLTFYNTSDPRSYVRIKWNSNANFGDWKTIAFTSDTMTPVSHTHGALNNDGSIGTTNNTGKNVVTDNNGKIGLEDKPSIPSASDTLPTADTVNGSIGNGTTWARSNHIHPKSDIYAEAVHTHGDTDLTWSETNTKNKVSPTVMAMSEELGANRLAFFPSERMTVEYSTDGGLNWTEKNTSTLPLARRTLLVTKEASNKNDFILGDGSNVDYSKNMLRVTLDLGNVGEYSVLYTYAKKIGLFSATNGSTGFKVQISTSLYSDEEDYTDYGEAYTLSGNRGWNILPFDTVIGGSTSVGQTGQDGTRIKRIRLTFSQTGGTGNAYLSRLRLYGDVTYSSPSSLADTGHIYSFNENQDVTFPSKIIKSGGLSSQFLKADGSVDSNSYSLTTHQHGQIESNGSITSNNVSFDGNDYPVITDNSDSNKLKKGFVSSKYIKDEQSSQYTSIGLGTDDKTQEEINTAIDNTIGMTIETQDVLSQNLNSLKTNVTNISGSTEIDLSSMNDNDLLKHINQSDVNPSISYIDDKLIFTRTGTQQGYYYQQIPIDTIPQNFKVSFKGKVNTGSAIKDLGFVLANPTNDSYELFYIRPSYSSTVARYTHSQSEETYNTYIRTENITGTIGDTFYKFVLIRKNNTIIFKAYTLDGNIVASLTETINNLNIEEIGLLVGWTKYIITVYDVDFSNLGKTEYALKEELEYYSDDLSNNYVDNTGLANAFDNAFNFTKVDEITSNGITVKVYANAYYVYLKYSGTANTINTNTSTQLGTLSDLTYAPITGYEYAPISHAGIINCYGGVNYNGAVYVFNATSNANPSVYGGLMYPLKSRLPND